MALRHLPRGMEGELGETPAVHTASVSGQVSLWVMVAELSFVPLGVCDSSVLRNLYKKVGAGKQWENVKPVPFF